MKKNQAKIKNTLTVDALCVVLEDLVKSMREGRVCIQKGAEFVTLTPKDLVEFELEAGQKKEKEKLTIEMQWRNIVQMPDTETTVKISSTEPVVEEEAVPTEDTAAPEYT